MIEQHTAGETTSGETTTALIQEEDGTYSSYYLTKADNEYYLINKKLRVDDDQPGDGKHGIYLKGHVSIEIIFLFIGNFQ